MPKSKYLKKKIIPFDPVRARTPDSLVSQLAGCSFQGRALASALDVWEAMARDGKSLRVMSLAGAMVPAGMGLLVVRLIERGLLDCIVCTGATISHDLCNTIAPDEQAHYIGTDVVDDVALRRELINRVHDTYISERSFQSAEDAMLDLLPRIDFRRSSSAGNGAVERLSISTSDFCRQMGLLLPGRSILTAAARHGVSIFVPAISDSELGLNIVTANAEKRLGNFRMEFDTLGDVEAFAEIVIAKPKAGLVSIGGGVPRNWAQQIYPYLNMKQSHRIKNADGYFYGVRITTDRPEFGGLSGCTISESKSWGKYVGKAMEATVICDATIALPVLVSALLQRLER